MQLNHSENNSCAEQATASSQCLDGGASRKRLLCCRSGLSRGLEACGEARALCGLSAVKDLFLLAVPTCP